MSADKDKPTSFEAFIGTQTGRMSAEKINLSNAPRKNKEIEKEFLNKLSMSTIVPIDLVVNIEKSELAKQLEEELDISWNLIQHHNYDAGFDLRACIPYQIVLGYGRSTIIATGLHFHMQNPYWEIQIRPRSGLAAKHNIMITNSPGTIDHGYREEVKIILYNAGREQFQVMPGDRIAQACFRPISVVEFNYVDKIEKTERGGFGSSGVK